MAVCTDFPFMLSLLPSRCQNLDGETACSHVLPLLAENPRRPALEHEKLDKAWTFCPKFAKSQSLVVEDGACELFDEHADPNSYVKLYAKTVWSLPSEDAIARREALLQSLCSSVRCCVYCDSCDFGVH